MTGLLSKQSGCTGAIHYVASKLEPTFKNICIYINILRYLYTNNVITFMYIGDQFLWNWCVQRRGFTAQYKQTSLNLKVFHCS